MTTVLHCKQLVTNLLKACGITLLLVCGYSSSLAGPPVSYSVNLELNGLNVTYYVKKTDLYITLFAFNQEAYPVLCDAQYHSGPDKTGGSEHLIPPGKGADFRFRYGRGNDKGQIDLQCVKIKAEDAPAADTQPADDVKIQDLSAPHAH